MAGGSSLVGIMVTPRPRGSGGRGAQVTGRLGGARFGYDTQRDMAGLAVSLPRIGVSQSDSNGGGWGAASWLTSTQTRSWLPSTHLAGLRPSWKRFL